MENARWDIQLALHPQSHAEVCKLTVDALRSVMKESINASVLWLWVVTNVFAVKGLLAQAARPLK